MRFAVDRRLQAKFPADAWHILVPAFYRHCWLAYTRMWHALVAEWDAGEVATVQPCGAMLYPIGGLRSVNDWSIKRGETRQRELIGMTAEVEVPTDTWAERLLSSSSTQ
eukprot:SAG31_NODE_567_length_14028_cov_4.022328_3_plen_109_part_00